MSHALEVVVANLDATFSSTTSQFGTPFAIAVVRSYDRIGQGERLMERNKRTREMTDEDFETEIHRSPLPVLVEFWAEWSGTCHIMAPIVESIKKSLTGRVKVVRMNIETCPRTVTQFSVRTVPTLLLFQTGELVELLSGMMSREELERRIERELDETTETTGGDSKPNHN